VLLKKDVDNVHQLYYNIVSGGASRMSMDIEVKDLLGDMPDTGRTYPVLLVEDKYEIDDAEGVCPEHDTTVYSGRQLPGCLGSSVDDIKVTLPSSKYQTENSDIPVKQAVDNTHQRFTDINNGTRAEKPERKVNDIKNVPTMHMECVSNLNPGAEVTHAPLTVLLVNVRGEVDEEESECVKHEAAVFGSRMKHECKTCMKSCTRKHDLTRHMVVHSGINPYKCVTCTSYSAHG
jgi:hypothetical protein